MNVAVVIAVVMMLAVLCAGVAVLQQDSRRRRVDRQVEATTFSALRRGTEAEEPRTLRLVARRRGNRRVWLYRLFGYDPTAARTGSTMPVVMLALLTAAGAAALGRMALPSWAVPLDALMTALLAVRFLFKRQRDKYADQLVRQLPDTIELVVSAVRAGLPLAEAFRAVRREMPEPTSAQFARVLDDLAVGRAPHEALLSLHDRSPVAEYAIFAVTLAVQSRSGGALAETLQILGETIRERVALAAKAKALAAEATLSARVLAALPFVAGGFMYLENHNSIEQLFTDPRGRMLFVGGMLSLALGVITMSRMIRKGTTV